MASRNRDRGLAPDDIDLKSNHRIWNTVGLRLAMARTADPEHLADRCPTYPDPVDVELSDGDTVRLETAAYVVVTEGAPSRRVSSPTSRSPSATWSSPSSCRPSPSGSWAWCQVNRFGPAYRSDDVPTAASPVRSPPDGVPGDTLTEADAARDGLQRLRYEPALDGIRGLGAILVFLVHLSMIVIPERRSMPSFLTGAYIYMDVFFVVSGFLITSILIGEQARTGSVAVGAFYKRRAIRLLPALWVMLLGHVIWAWIVGFDAVGGARTERNSVVLAAVHLLNFRLDSVLAPVAVGLTHLWSLAIEEQFYIVWPLVVAYLLPIRRSLPRNVAYLVGGIVAIAWHRYRLADDGADWMRLYTYTDTRADSVLVGALIAYLWTHRVVPVAILRPAAWCGAAALALYTWKGRQDLEFNSKGGFTLMAIASACIVLAIMETDWPVRRLLAIEPLRRLGVASYSLYLWHVPIQVMVAHGLASWAPAARVVASVVLTAAVTTLSFLLVERPVLRRGARIRRERAATVLRAPAPA